MEWMLWPTIGPFEFHHTSSRRIDRIAREEFRTPLDTVRMLVQRALFDRQLAASHQRERE